METIEIYRGPEGIVRRRPNGTYTIRCPNDSQMLVFKVVDGFPVPATLDPGNVNLNLLAYVESDIQAQEDEEAKRLEQEAEEAAAESEKTIDDIHKAVSDALKGPDPKPF